MPWPTGPDRAARRDHPAAADPLAPAAPAGVSRGARRPVRPGQRSVLGGLPAGPPAPGSVRGRPVARVRGQPGHHPRRSSGNSFDLIDSAASYPALPIVRAQLARALFSVGRADEAEAVYATLRSLPETGDRDTRTLGALLQLLDLMIAFGDAETARASYDLLGPHTADTGVIGSGVVILFGSLHWPLGRLAALLGRFDDALAHFAAAVTINTKAGARPFVALARLDWADALRSRAAPGDSAEALVLARQAAAETRRLDMPGHLGRGQRAGTPAGAGGPGRRSAHPARARDRRARLGRARQPGDRRPAGALRADGRRPRQEHAGQAAARQPDGTCGLGAAE